MNNRILLVAGATALTASVLSTTASAATVSATGNANVLQPLAILETAQMEFGDVAGLFASASSVDLSIGGLATSSDGATVFATGNADAAGAFSLTGSGTLAYTITLPADGVVTLTGAGDPMAVDGFIDSAGGALGVPGVANLVGGNGAFTVGATLTINANQTPGAYAGNYTVIVNYQ